MSSQLPDVILKDNIDRRPFMPVFHVLAGLVDDRLHPSLELAQMHVLAGICSGC